MTSEAEDFLEHFGVKGMKWGVRQTSSPTKEPSARQARYDMVRNREMASFSVKTKLGEKVDVEQKPVGKLGAYLTTLSKSGTKDALSNYEFDFSVGGKPVGKASMERRSADELYLNWLGVDSNQRGKGYGSAVFDAAVKHGQDTGVKKITLEVPVKSPDAQHIYEKQGFVVTKQATKKEIEEDPLWGGLNEMELDLTKIAVKHALTDDDQDLEDALFTSFATLPKELETELFGEGDEVEQSGINEDVDDFLEHFGVKGMKWGQRSARPDGVSSKVNRAASKDAAEFARAKMFYGEGAGTRRKLIKAQVEAKSKLDPNYKKAFDHHLSKQDMGKQAVKAKSERRRKDVASSTTKTAKGVHRQLTGGFGNVSLASAILAGGVVAARSTGADKVIFDAAKTAVKNAKKPSNKGPEDWLKKNGFL